MMRVYAPLTLADLEALDRDGGFTAPVAFAVTEELTRLLPDGDSEEHEHLATQLAAAACSGRPVAVVALDVRPERVTPRDDAPGLVALEGDVAPRDVVCCLVADDGVEPSDDADLELSWYDAGERAAVRERLGG